MNMPPKPGIYNLCFSSLTKPENWISSDCPASFLDAMIDAAKIHGTEVVGWCTTGGIENADHCSMVIENCAVLWDEVKALIYSKN